MIEDIRYISRHEWIPIFNEHGGPSTVGNWGYKTYLQFKRDGIWHDVPSILELPKDKVA